MRSLFALALCAIFAIVTSVGAQELPNIGGTYAVHGTNAGGSKYTGTVVISPAGKRFKFNWLLSSGETYTGVGTMTDTTLVVDWGHKYPVIYEVGPDGVLHGKWDNARATETLIPKP